MSPVVNIIYAELNYGILVKINAKLQIKVHTKYNKQTII